MPQHLETPRLILRRFAPGDWPAVKTMLSDPLTTRFMHFARLTEAEGREWFDSTVASANRPDANPRFWLIARKGSEDAIGWLGVETIDDPVTGDERHVGYLLDHRHWNQGFMTEALTAALTCEFESRGATVVRATCDTANLPSARVMEKAGMRREKTEYRLYSGRTWTERHHYVMTRGDDEARR